MCTCDPNCSGCKTPHPKLRIKLVKFEKALAMQVLEMDERFRSAKEEYSPKKFTASNKLDVLSGTEPYLSLFAVHLWGDDDSQDANVVSQDFVSNADRDDYIHRVLTALREWAAKWEGFENDARTDALGDSTDISTF